MLNKEPNLNERTAMSVDFWMDNPEISTDKSCVEGIEKNNPSALESFEVEEELNN